MKISSRIKSRIAATLREANKIDGYGTIIAIVYGKTGDDWAEPTDHGIIVRQDGMGVLDAISFKLLHRGVYVLGKVRILLPCTWIKEMRKSGN